MPFLNVDTGHHFPELNEFRDRRAAQLGAKLIVRTVEDAIAKGIAVPAPGEISRNRLQIPTLLAAIEEFRFDCCIGGARRDEEKARAKERFFSFRDASASGTPRTSAPRSGTSTTPASTRRKHARVPAEQLDRDGRLGVHPREKLEVPSIYFSHPASACAAAASGCRSHDEFAAAQARNEEVREDWSCASAPSATSSAPAWSNHPPTPSDDIIAEIAAARVTERGSRADDKASEAAMEDRKKQGYF
jgi:sulfate adenylyltransferase subunit 2